MNMTLEIIMDRNLLFNIKKERFFSLRNKMREKSNAVRAKGKEMGINKIDKS